ERTCILSSTGSAELGFDPLQVFGKKHRRLTGEAATILVKLSAKRADGTSSLCKGLTIFQHRVHAGTEPLFRRTRFIPGPATRPQLRQALVDYGLADVVL